MPQVTLKSQNQKTNDMDFIWISQMTLTSLIGNTATFSIRSYTTSEMCGRKSTMSNYKARNQKFSSSTHLKNVIGALPA